MYRCGGQPAWINSLFLGQSRQRFPESGRYAATPFGEAMQARYDRRGTDIERLKDFAVARGDALRIAGVHEGSSMGRHRNEYKKGNAGIEAALGYIYQWRKAGFPPGIITVLQAQDRGKAWHKYERALVRERAEKPQAPEWAFYPDVDIRLAFFFLVEVLHEDDQIQERRHDYTRALYEGKPSDGMLLHGENGLLLDATVDARRVASKWSLNPAYAFDPTTGARPIEAPVEPNLTFPVRRLARSN